MKKFFKNLIREIISEELETIAERIREEKLSERRYMEQVKLANRLCIEAMHVKETLWVAAVKFLLDGSANHSLAVLRAHWNYILILFRILKKRSKNDQDNSLLIHKRLLVMDYFLRKRKYFHQLKMR